MELNNLIVDTNFLTFFRNNSEAVSKITVHWNFRKSIEGNHENIPFFLKLLESISENCRWITFETVYIPYYKEIFGDDEK